MKTRPVLFPAPVWRVDPRRQDPSRHDPLRRRLMLGLPGGLALGLVGCGGGSGDDAASVSGTDAAVADAVKRLPALTRSAQGVTVSLPAGSGVSLAGTQVVSANNVSEVRPDGSAGVVAVEGAPQMAYVFDAAGRLLLMGVIEAGVRTALDARGTAEALLLLVSEAAAQGPAIELALRRTLATHAIVEPVRLAVEGAAARNGIVATDTALMDALGTAVRALRGQTTVAPMASGRAQAQSVSVVPASAQSGVTVAPTDDYNTVQLTNRFRRRTHVWIARTGYFGTDQQPVQLPAPVPLTDFALDATTALSFDNLVVAVGDYLAEMAEDIGFLGAYEAGNASWRPVSSAPVALPFEPATASGAVYRARVVGVGATDGGQMTGAEAAALDAILGQTLWEDVILPFLKTLVLPFVSERIPATGSARFTEDAGKLLINGMSDLTNLAISGSYFPATAAALKAGDARAVMTQFLTEFFSSNTFQGLFEIGLRAFVKASGAGWTVRDGQGTLIGVNLLSQEDLVAQNVGRLKDGLGKLARIIQLIKVATLVGDYGALAKDWSASSRVSEFVLDVGKAKVSLTPKTLSVKATAGAAGKGAVTCTVTDLDGIAPESVFLDWTCSARYGHLYKRGSEGLDTFESVLNNPTHDYIPLGITDDPDVPDVVTVKAWYRNATTNQRVEIGSATAQVEFKGEFTLEVNPAVLQDVPADHDFTVTGYLRENLPDGATVAWTWSHGGVGSLETLPADANRRDSAVVFHAGGSEGAATATVSAVVSLPATASAAARTVKVKPATAQLQVKKGLKTLTVRGGFATDVVYTPWVCSNCGPGGSPQQLVAFGVSAYATVPKVSGYQSCAVVMTASDPYIGKNRSFTPETVFVGSDPEHSTQDRGGAIWLGLSGYGGSDTGPDSVQTIYDYFYNRFADLVVTATYTLKP